MGHWCRICGEVKSNEKFSGKGHKTHICKQCASRPKDEIAHIDQCEEICGFLSQSRISTKNIRRLREMAASDHEETARLARIVLDVATVAPYKKRRTAKLALKRKDLLRELEESDLAYPYHW